MLDKESLKFKIEFDRINKNNDTVESVTAKNTFRIGH
jgi:hypothetical protein